MSEHSYLKIFTSEVLKGFFFFSESYILDLIALLFVTTVYDNGCLGVLRAVLFLPF